MTRVAQPTERVLKNPAPSALIQHRPEQFLDRVPIRR